MPTTDETADGLVETQSETVRRLRPAASVSDFTVRLVSVSSEPPGVIFHK